MNKKILHGEVQLFIKEHLNSDTGKLSLSKDPFPGISAAEITAQIISGKKAEKKLPTWFNTPGIFYPPSLSIEQTSSEITAAFKATLIEGKTLLDITAGFGVDDFYFAHRFDEVIACENDENLAQINAHNCHALGLNNIKVIAGDGVAFITQTNLHFDVIYIDPARRNETGKVFKLTDCTPDVPEILDLLLSKGKKVLIKTSPLLDISAGLAELKHVAALFIISVKNECKELLWLLESSNTTPDINITCVTLNRSVKQFSFRQGDVKTIPLITGSLPAKYLYEPDAALLKSGAFNLIGNRFGLEKLHPQSQLYASDVVQSEFPGRIFFIEKVFTTGQLKKEKELEGNVIVRNYREKAETLVKKYKVKPSKTQFLIFTEVGNLGYHVFSCRIVQYY